MNIIDPKRRD